MQCLRMVFARFPGTQPYASEMPQGCPFGPRCPRYTQECSQSIPWKAVGDGRVRCLHIEEKADMAAEDSTGDGMRLHRRRLMSGCKAVQAGKVSIQV